MKEEYLPSRRTFLLRFSSSAQPKDGIHRGRIEHIPSGRTARFTSLQSIDDFVQDILAHENGLNSDNTTVTDSKENHNEH
jgi:hypothetical protein